MKHQKEIKKITDQIVKKYKPEKIILFGSYAWGKPTEDSDVDLFIVKETRKSMTERMRDVRKLVYRDEYYGDKKRFPGPMDIIVYTPAQLKKELELGDFFIEEIIKEGKTMYEQKN